MLQATSKGLFITCRRRCESTSPLPHEAGIIKASEFQFLNSEERCLTGSDGPFEQGHPNHGWSASLWRGCPSDMAGKGPRSTEKTQMLKTGQTAAEPAQEAASHNPRLLWTRFQSFCGLYTLSYKILKDLVAGT